MPRVAVVSLLVFHALTLCTDGQEAGGPGKVDCPCATPQWSGFEALAARVEASGFPTDYGLVGCRDYDAELNATGCNGPPPRPGYCAAQWCYVDTDSCAANRQDCAEAGLHIGERGHFACRARPMLESALIPGSVYSYETCGFLNSYDVDRASQVIGERSIIAVATHDAPYVSVQERPGPGGTTVLEYSGVEYSFVQMALDHFVSPVDVLMEDGWATAESREKFPSSYTACVHDVAVGNFDICIGDFWVTSERMLMTIFLPSFRTDTFYLVVFDDATVWDFDELLRNPFKPFSNEAWGLIAGVVVFKALVEAVLDFAEEGEHGPFTTRCFHALYMAWISLFSGNSRFKGISLPAKISNMGWQIFLLIVVASYKANLAKMLILRKTGTSITSIEDAIEHRLKICIPTAIETTIRLNYPSGDYVVYGGSTSDFARQMHAGRCDTAVIHLKRIEQLHGGWIHRGDCDSVHEGRVSEEEGRCEKGHLGLPRDDCAIVRVGDVLLTIPIAFPVSSDPSLVNPLSWAFTQAQNSGEWEAAVISNSHLFPESYCDLQFQKAQRLGKESFAAGSFFVALAVVLASGVYLYQQHEQKRNLNSAPGPDGGTGSAGANSEAESVSASQRAILAKLSEVAELVRQQGGLGDGNMPRNLKAGLGTGSADSNFEIVGHLGLHSAGSGATPLTHGPGATGNGHHQWNQNSGFQVLNLNGLPGPGPGGGGGLGAMSAGPEGAAASGSGVAVPAASYMSMQQGGVPQWEMGVGPMVYSAWPPGGVPGNLKQ